MRLINVHTLKFGDFYDEQVPPYAILSHRWGAQEISYKDFQKGRNKDWLGYRKVLKFCGIVRERWSDVIPALDRLSPNLTGIDWAWVDTCCIDKRSSAELSEAINSMFAWSDPTSAPFREIC